MDRGANERHCDPFFRDLRNDDDEDEDEVDCSAERKRTNDELTVAASSAAGDDDWRERERDRPSMTSAKFSDSFYPLTPLLLFTRYNR